MLNKASLSFLYLETVLKNLNEIVNYHPTTLKFEMDSSN